MNQSTTRKQSRIPSTLQAVFLASNRGKDVSHAPPDKTASKTFFRNWIFQGKSLSGSKNNASDRSRNGLRGFFSKKGRALKTEPEKKVDPVEHFVPETFVPTISPQVYLDMMLRSRGYSTRRYQSKLSAYYNKPTALQLASYDVYLIGLVRNNKAEEFRQAIHAGLSPNACNSYSESIVHTVCRRGFHEMLDTLLEHGATVQVSDDYGRTPLHDACWAVEPAFDAVTRILERDARLVHIMDVRSNVPFAYIKEEHWGAWTGYLDTIKDRIWPDRSGLAAAERQGAPPLASEEPNSRMLWDPKGALPLELAALVASGRMTGQEAQIMLHKSDETEDETMATDDNSYDDGGNEDTDDDYTDSDFESDDYDSEDEDDDSSLEEMNDLLNDLMVINNGPAVRTTAS